MSRSGRGYSPALDGLRGVFILLFIGYHFGLTELEGMWVTINLFFVLSGFLIVRLLTAEQSRYGSIDVWDFYKRRIRRLVPALLAMLLFVMAWGALAAPEGVRRKLGGDVLATLGYVMNWRLIEQGDQYFGTAGGASPLRHAWTLAIEEQFYLVAPLVLIALYVLFRNRRISIAVLLVGAVASAVWTAYLGFHDQSDYPRLYYGTDTRAQALFIGAAIGVLRAPKGQGPAAGGPADAADLDRWPRRPDLLGHLLRHHHAVHGVDVQPGRHARLRHRQCPARARLRRPPPQPDA